MHVEKILRNTIILGVFLLILTPVIFSSNWYFPYIVGKGVYFRVIVEIIFALWVYGIIFYKDFRPKLSAILYSILAFMLVFLLANMFGEDSYVSFWTNYERMEGYITYIHLFLFFLVAGSVLVKEKLWFIFFNLSILLSFILDLHGLHLFFEAQEEGRFLRVASFFGNPIYFAEFLLFNLFLALLYMRKSGALLRLGYGLVIVLNMVMISLTATRGAVLGVAVGVFVILILVALFAKSEKPYPKVALYTLVTLVVLSGVFFAVKDTSFVQENSTLKRFANTSLTNKTVIGRFVNWRIAWNGFTEKPVLGWGQSNYNLIFDRDFDPIMHDQEQWFDHVHNIALDMLVSGGLLGFLSYFFIFIALLYCIWKDKDWLVTEKSILTGLLVAYVVQNFFVFDNIVSYMLFFALLAYVHSRHSSDSRWADLEVKDTTINRSIAIILIVITLFIALYQINYKPYRANTLLLGAKDFIGVDENNQPYVKHQDAGLSRYVRAYSLDTFGNGEIAREIMQAAPRAQSFDWLDQDTKRKFIELGYLVGQDQVEKHPKDSKQYFLFGQFLVNTGNFKDGENFLRKAVEMSPTKPSITGPLISTYLLQDKYDEALELSGYAYQLETGNDTAWQLYANSLFVSGNRENFDQLISEAIEEEEVERIEDLYRSLLRSERDNFALHLEAVDVLLRINEFTEVEKLTAEILERFPNRAGELKALFNRYQVNVSGL